MATVTATFPRPRRASRNRPAVGRASYPEIYFLKHIDNSSLRREIDPEKRRECYSLLGLGVLVFLFMLLFAWQHFQCVRYGYQIEQLKAFSKTLEESNHQLRLEQAALADPERIDTLARTELGLAAPAPRQVIQTGVGEAVPGSPAEFARNFAASGGEATREQ